MRSYSNNGGFIGRTFNINDEDYFIDIGSAPEAIQYVGGTTAAFVGSTTNDIVSLTTLTGGIASAPQYGDLIIVAVELSGTANKAYKIANFTQIADLYQNDTEDSNFQVGYKLTSIVPETSVLITNGSGNTADGIAVAVHVYRNIDQTTPFDVTMTTFGALNGAIPNPSAITPVTSGALIVVAAGAAHDATAAGLFTASYLSDFITTTTVALAETNDATVGMGNVAWTSGAYDPAAWTFTGTGGTAANWSYNSVTMALRPGPTVTLGNKRNSGILDLPGQISPKLLNVVGQQEYLAGGGPFSFVVPENLYEISALAIGAGGGGGGWGNGSDESAGGGGGGALAYAKFAVTPGETLTINVGAAGNGGGSGNNGGAGNTSSVQRDGTNLVAAGGGGGGQSVDASGTAGGAGGTVITGTGFPGGRGGNNSETTGAPGCGGGGAGGYFGAGGRGGDFASRSGLAGTNDAGGGGAALQGATAEPAATFGTGHGGGGGVGVYGPTTAGVGGVPSSLFLTVATIGTATYTSRTTTNVTGTGSGATFNVTQNAANNGYTVTLVSGGTGYSATAGSNTIRILGTNVGGATTANDITITITAINAGTITTFTIPAAGAAGNLSAGNAMATLTSTRGVATGGTGGPFTITNASAGVVVTNGSGGTAPSGTWSITVTLSGAVYTTSVTTGGTAFGVNDTIFIPYTLIGGAVQSGGGGSDGAAGTSTGGLYGGGGRSALTTNGSGSAGAIGAIRLIWGKELSFPAPAPSGIVSITTQAGIVFFPQIDQY